MRVHTSVQTAGTELMDVQFVSGEAYEVAVRGSRVLVDQPADAGGEDTAPTHRVVRGVAGDMCRVLRRPVSDPARFSRDGLGVSVGFDMAADRPARVVAVRLTVRVPADLPAERRTAIEAVVSHYRAQQPDHTT